MKLSGEGCSDERIFFELTKLHYYYTKLMIANLGSIKGKDELMKRLYSKRRL